MPNTTRRAIPYPAGTDAPNIPTAIQNIANVLDLDMPFYTGTLAARPAFGSVVQGSWYYATDNGSIYFNTGAAWVQMAQQSTAQPSGSMMMYAGAAAPTGWLLCDGSAVDRTTYAALYAALGGASSPWGEGDGSTTFNLPDMRGRVPLGVGTATGARGATAHALGAIGGEETHQLSVAEMPSHNHTGTTGIESASHYHNVAGTTGTESADHTHNTTTTDEILSYGATNVANGSTAQVNHVLTYGGITHTSGGRSAAHTHSFNVNSGTESANHTHTFTTASVGGTGDHNNLQPFTVVNYIIKT